MEEQDCRFIRPWGCNNLHGGQLYLATGGGGSSHWKSHHDDPHDETDLNIINTEGTDNEQGE